MTLGGESHAWVANLPHIWGECHALGSGILAESQSREYTT